MITSIHGPITQIAQNFVSVLTGPIGLGIYVPDSSLFSLQQTVTLEIYMHWNAEQGPTLYGFQKPLEKTLFITIISCSGIGPKIGLAALASLGAHEFIAAVQTGDARRLSTVPGIGIKKAEQIIVQIKSKIEKLNNIDTIMSANPKTEQWHTINQALQSLNYSRPEIQSTMEYLHGVANQSAVEFSFDQLMRKALSFLSRQH